MKNFFFLFTVVGILVFLLLLPTKNYNNSAASKSSSKFATPAEVEKALSRAFPNIPSKFNVTHSAIILSMLIDPTTDYKKCVDIIQTMSEDLKIKIAGTTDPDTIVNSITNYFFTEKNFVYTETAKQYFSGTSTSLSIDDMKDFYSINRLLTNGTGTTLSFSIMYLIMGEKLSLPIYGAVSPERVYARYITTGNAGITIEPTATGAEYSQPDETFFGAVDETNKKIYGDNLGSLKVIGLYAYQAGMLFEMADKTQQAFLCYKKAAEVNPDNATIRFTLGECYTKNKNPQQAEIEITAAVQLLPSNPSFHLALAKLYLEEKHFLRAENECYEALRLAPSDAEANNLLEEIKNKNK